MIYDFLSDCKCALSEEVDDFRDVLTALSKIQPCIGFMPAITDDLYPVFALLCTSAARIVSPNVYVVPVGAKDGWAKPYFEKIVAEFYAESEIREQYEIELEEMILLNTPVLDVHFLLNRDIRYNVLWCCVTMPNGSTAYLLFVPVSPEAAWKKVIEPYKIKCAVLIDSCKGLGNWLEDTKLHKAMKETTATALLPQYYFRGLYISHEPPHGFHRIYKIPEQIADDCGRLIGDWQKEIYQINWDENND